MLPGTDSLRWLGRSRDRLTTDVNVEIEFHLSMVADRLIADGWNPTDAALEARRRFGDIDTTQRFCVQQDLKRHRHRNRMVVLTEFAQDLRFTLRSLRKAPGFASVVLLTLALGIGANTAIFSVVRAVLLEPLPFKQPDQLVRVWHENSAKGVTQGRVSEPDFLDWRRESRLTSSMGGFFYLDGAFGQDLTGDGPPLSVTSALVAEGFFETLGTPALYGRTISHDDQLAGRGRVVVLGNALWRSRFSADPSVVGRTVMLSNQPYEIVGVMPEHFAYPAEKDLDVWMPLSLFGEEFIGRGRRAAFQGVFARMKPGVTESQLREDLSGIAARIAQAFPGNRDWNSVSVMSMRESIVGNVSRPLALLFGAVFLVLLIACANVASLLLARASYRQRELAVRAALGAGRGRLTRQLLTESLVLALGGAALGMLLAYWAVRAVTASGLEIPRSELVRVDGTVLLFALVLSLVTGLLFGLVPALRATGASLTQALRAGARGSLGSGLRLRRGLVVAQMALAVVLVIGAALTTKSFARIQSTNLGFNANNALYVDLRVSDRFNSLEKGKAQYQALLEAIRATPGVTAVGSIRDLPTLGTGETGSIVVSGMAENAESGPIGQYHHVSSGYFAAMGIPVQRGRDFDARDRDGVPTVAIVDEEFARRLLPGQDPTTHSLRYAGSDVRIIGVVGSVRQGGATQPLEPTVYFHTMQFFRSHMSIVVGTHGAPLAMSNAVRQSISQLDPLQTIVAMEPLDAVLGRSIARPRLLATVFAMFGVLGLLLGAVGVYGVLAYSVTQRRQEIGVRMALGASPGSVRSMIVKQGVMLASAGVLIGVLGALAVTRIVQSVLFGIEAADMTTFVQVVMVVVTTAVLASWVPARRGTMIDPAVALREE